MTDPVYLTQMDDAKRFIFRPDVTAATMYKICISISIHRLTCSGVSDTPNGTALACSFIYDQVRRLYNWKHQKHVKKIQTDLLNTDVERSDVCNIGLLSRLCKPGSAFIKPDQLYPWIKDQIKTTLLSTISHLQLPNFVSCGRACPSHMTHKLVTVGAKLWTAECFLIDPWSMDYADPVW